MSTVCLQIDGLCLAYESHRVVEGISLSVAKGAIVGLLGRNGSGKSTVLRAVAGILDPREGKIQFEGIDITGWKPRRLIQCGISYVAQSRECFLDLTVRENLDVPLIPLGLRRYDRRIRKQEALDSFPMLADVCNRPAHHLSGGFRQMLVLAMALVQRPRCILLDEPSLGLSQESLSTLSRFMRSFASNGGSILLVEQKPSFVLRVGDYFYYLDSGKITTQGLADQLHSHPGFVEQYLGLGDENIFGVTHEK